MAAYSDSSQRKLDTAHHDLQLIFNEVVRIFDNTILYGNRSVAYQFDLYKQGRAKDDNGKWVIVDKSKVVTYCDGTKNKSKHNYTPSKAVDAVPYYTTIPHIRWKDTDRMYYFAGHVKAIAIVLKTQGRITHDIKFGGDWDDDTEVKDQTFMDLAHFEIIN